MLTTLRNILAISAVVLFSLSTTANTNKDKPSAVKVKTQAQEARTLDGKKPKACDFRISLS